MGRKPRIALMGLLMTGGALVGCESCTACRANKPWGQDKVLSSTASSTNSSTPVAWGNGARPASSSSGDASNSALAGGATTRLTDPGMSPVAPASAMSPGNNAAPASTLSSAGQAQPTYPGLPPASSLGSGDPSSRVSNPAPAAGTMPPVNWPSTPASSNPSSLRSPETATTPTQTRDSSYQTRYPDLQMPPAVSTVPRVVSPANP